MRPNILIISCDQLRYDACGPARPRFLRTPHIDALADDGIWCEQAYADCPICVAQRMALMTGKSCYQHGMATNGKTCDHIPDDAETLPGRLSALGYHTCQVGKAHFNPQRARHGFQESVTLDSYYRMMVSHGGLQPRRHGLGENELVAGMATVPEAQTITSWITETAAEWIRHGRDPRSPWFLWVNYTKPHPPLDPPEPYYSMYRNSTIPAPLAAPWVRSPDAPAAMRARYLAHRCDELGDDQLRAARAAYYGLVTQIDFGIGRLLGAIQDTGAHFKPVDDTLIIFTSDHGEHLGDHGLKAKSDPLEGSWRIPLLVRTPTSWKADRRHFGHRLRTPACVQDVAATCLAAAGGNVPADWYGRDLLAQVRGEAPPRDHVLGGFRWSKDRMDRPEWSGIVDGVWKYVWWYEGGDEQLFHLEEDPGEYLDRAADPVCAGQLARLRGLLMDGLRSHRPAWCDGDRPLRLPRPVIDEAAARRSAFAGHMWDHHPNDAMH